MVLDKILDTLYNASPISLGLALSLVLLTIVFIALRRRNLPPGPTGLPYLGMYPFLSNENIAVKLDEMKIKYGDVFSFTITGRLFINLGSIKAVREAHITKSDCFGGRLPGSSLLEIFFENGVGFTKGEAWKVLRKFFIRVLKERTAISEKNSMIGPVYDSIKSTIIDLKEEKGKPLNLIELLTTKCTTNLRLMLFSEVGASEEQMKKIMELYAEELEGFMPLNLLLSGSIMRFLFPLQPAFRKALKSHRKIEEILFDIVKEHKSTYDEENIRDIIDDYFKERDLKRSKADPTAEYFTDVALVQSLTQFVSDGVLSIASAISILMKFLIERPEEQEKIYKEIIEVVGTDRQPTVEDKSKLTKLNAFISEGMRVSNAFPIFPGVECIKETTLNGYRIPKGAVTVTNFYSCHADPEVYEEPEKFNPSRFVSTEEKRREELPITFGVGKRACIGEGYTMIQSFLFLATVIQNFELKFPEDMTASAQEVFMSGKLPVCAHPRSHL
ncbi:cytochrome P450 2A9-like [Argiope bruennichi]|uniref:cytochrome P450 2A9-like n=1 Tax=Argiope bruennichi TaxID=94029 RepID=UPI0024955EEA|nr:cytochrome P450 2A9-like [Argiope bruennichi]XP_055934663.1 cytochrome P450 2A9-like [Argiope bruennichi]